MTEVISPFGMKVMCSMRITTKFGATFSSSGMSTNNSLSGPGVAASTGANANCSLLNASTTSCAGSETNHGDTKSGKRQQND